MKKEIALLEAMLVMMLVVAIATNLVSFAYGVALEAVLAIIYLGFIWASRKKFAGKKEYPVFFVLLMLLIQLAWIPMQLGFLGPGIQNILLVATVFIIVLFVMLFRLFFSRNWAWAKVVSCSGGRAVVETEYDFFNGIGNSFAEVACGRKLGKGERVKVRLRQSLFGKKPDSVE